VTDQGDRRATYREVLGVGEFRALLLSRVLTITGVSLRMLAVSVLVLAATHSPLLAGVAFGVGFLPQILGGLTLLSLADRVRPRRAMALGALVEAGAAATVAAVPLPTWGVLALLAAVAVLTPVFSAAASALVPSLLTGDGYVLGRSLLVMTSAAAQIAGLGLGGLALALVSPRGALLVVVGLQLVAAALIRLLLADRPPRSAGARTGTGTVRATWAGNRALVTDRAVRGQLLAQVLPPSLATGAEGMVVAYAAQAHLPEGSAGPLLAAFPVGMALGNVLVGRFAAPAARERLTRALLVLLGGPLLLFAFAPPLLPAAALLLLAATGTGYELGIQRRFLEAVPEDRRGQAFGLVSTLLMFGQGVGPVLSGALASTTSPAVAIAASGAAVLLATALLSPHLRPAAREARYSGAPAGAGPYAPPPWT
jgi:MFS family permease